MSARSTFGERKIFKNNSMLSVKSEVELFLNDAARLNINGLTPSIILKNIDTYVELIHMYLFDARPWSLAYSGGKDSTVTVDICLKSLLLIKHIYGEDKLSKITYVMFSDTLLEMDPVIESILISIDEIEKFGILHNLKLNVKKVSPILKHTFFSLIIGKGYKIPSKSNRFCTDRLKILPQKKAILEILNSNKSGFIAITGQRKDESSDRAKRMKQQTIDGSFKKHDFKNCNLYAPVENWSTEDIWNYIYYDKSDWIDSNTLGRVYAEASNDGGECRSLLEGYSGLTPLCSKSSRFGCWTCTLFDFDKTLNNLSKNYSYMSHLEEFRNWLVQFRESKWTDNRDIFIHGKHKMKDYDRENHRKGMKIPGGSNLYFRKEILRRLLATEKKVISNRKHLITSEELTYIQSCWIEDGDLDMSVLSIASHREVKIDPLYEKVVAAVETVRGKTYYREGGIFFNENWLVVNGLNRNVCARYYAQMAIQLEKRGYDSLSILNSLNRNDLDEYKKTNIILIRSLPVETRMDFMDQTKENYIRKEWDDDKIGFWTFMERREKGDIPKPQKNLFGFDGDYASHFNALEELEEKGDILQCDQISLADKMRFFDNW